MKIHGCQDVRDGDAVPENLRAMFSGFGKWASDGLLLLCFYGNYDVVRNVSGVVRIDLSNAENRGLSESLSEPSFVPHRVYPGGLRAFAPRIFVPFFRAVFRSVAAAAFSPRLQPGVGCENTIHQP